MDGWLVAAVVLGLVEGLTEFIPVSSTGHLILVGNLIHFNGDRAATFEVFIQLGAILAVVVAYAGRFKSLFQFRKTEGFAGARGIGLLIVTTIPAIIAGFLLRGFIREHLFSPASVAAGLGVGGVWILLTERFLRKPVKESLDGLTWKDALWIGCFQCLSLWPGMSRSASTILGGMIVGVERRTATEYSFFAAVPLMTAAVLYDLVKSLPVLSRADIPLFAVGFLISFVSALFAVRFLIRFLGRHTLAPFGWYRIAVAILVFAVLR